MNPLPLKLSGYIITATGNKLKYLFRKMILWNKKAIRKEALGQCCNYGCHVSGVREGKWAPVLSLIKTKPKKQAFIGSSVPAAGEVDLRFAEVAADLSDEVS